MLKFPKNTEVSEKKVDVEEALSRVRKPLASTKLNFNVFGIYNLPESWKAKIDEPQEQSYTYEVEMSGMHMRNSKVIPRELTEEEKAEAEATKTKGNKKDPPPKGKATKEEEPTPEELERIEREKAEKEEKERIRQAEWDALDEETKLFRTAEDKFKEPSIHLQNMPLVEKLEKLKASLAEIEDTEENAAARKEIQDQIITVSADMLTGEAICEKRGFELIEFEEWATKD